MLPMSVELMNVMSLSEMWYMEKLDILPDNLLALFHMVEQGIALFMSETKVIWLFFSEK